jgi:RHH-type rel operon transcriptional repressor/antitoxin RelB
VASHARLTTAIEARLDQLIEQGIDDLEDAYLGAAVLERIRSGKEQTWCLNDVMTELDLDASDL